MEMTKASHSSSDDAKLDIQVVTDIQVRVEDRNGNATGWRTPVSNREWEDKNLAITRGSTDTLVKLKEVA